jgi:anti-anti-sigma regulatory factor
MEDHSILRLEGECTVTLATEMKNLLLEGMASGTELRIDLERAEAIDVSILQLLYASGRAGAKFSGQPSEATRMAAREAGFGAFLWTAVQG